MNYTGTLSALQVYSHHHRNQHVTYALEQQQQQRKVRFTWNGEAHVREAAEVVPCPVTAIVARAWGCGAGYHKWTLARQHPQYPETGTDGQGLRSKALQASVCSYRNIVKY